MAPKHTTSGMGWVPGVRIFCVISWFLFHSDDNLRILFPSRRHRLRHRRPDNPQLAGGHTMGKSSNVSSLSSSRWWWWWCFSSSLPFCVAAFWGKVYVALCFLMECFRVARGREPYFFTTAVFHGYITSIIIKRWRRQDVFAGRAHVHFLHPQVVRRVCGYFMFPARRLY